MRQFLFRLEKLLELRKYEEREWELKLARAVGACLIIENRINDLSQIISGGVLAGKSEAKLLDVGSIMAGQIYITRLVQEKATLGDELVEKEKVRDEVSREYLERSKRRKVLEKLKEKKGREYYKIQRLAEFKVMDEINDGAASRKKVQGGGL